MSRRGIQEGEKNIPPGPGEVVGIENDFLGGEEWMIWGLGVEFPPPADFRFQRLIFHRHADCASISSVSGG